VVARGVLVELVRLPAVLSVPGDALVGAALGRTRRGNLLALSSSALYAGGMALNDYSDRLVDALERPGRPIPSGRIAAAQARAVALALLASGVASARLLGGRRTKRVVLPLAALVWEYDMRAKRGAQGPVVMAACRGLDVLLGASPGALLPALPAAAAVAGHTANVTTLSRQEADGADVATVAAARRGALVVAAMPLLLSLRSGRRAAGLTALGSALYLAQCVPPLSAAVADPAAAQRAVGANVLGIIPLQAALLAAAGTPLRAMAVLGLLPIARRAARRRRVS